MKEEASYINQYFDQVYVLNLESRPDRKSAMLQKLSRLGIGADFVQAVNGYSYQNKIEYQSYLKSPIGSKGSHPLEVKQERKLITSPGAWGYLKTYYGILLDAKKRGFKRILCFDDDVLFHKEFENRFQEAVANIPSDWKLLYLGASQYVWRTPEGLSYPKEKKSPYYFPNNTDGSFALGLHVDIYDLLAGDILEMNCPFDSGPLRTAIDAYPSLCFVLYPNLVIADVSESDIREGQEQSKLASQLKWNMDDYTYPVSLDLVSVIMPAYNAQETIERAIQSILMQSYSNLELIVVDDGSTDHTVEIVEKMAKEDDRVILIALAENKGVGHARNEGLKKSKGSLIAFQDADDISLKDRLAYQIIPLYEEKVLFTVCKFYRSRYTMEELDLDNQEATVKKVESRRIPNKYGFYDYKDRANVGLVTTVYKRSVFETYGLYSDRRFGEDLEFVERLLHYRLHMSFDKKNNGHFYLSNTAYLEKTYKKVDKVLYISAEMNENNLTSQNLQKEKENRKIEQHFRNKYLTGDLRQYKKLDPLNLQARIGSTIFNSLKLDTQVILSEVEYQILLGLAAKSRKSDPSIDKFKNSLSWKITAPLRWMADIFIHTLRILNDGDEFHGQLKYIS